MRLLALAAILLLAPWLAAADRPPNVVLIYCDDLGIGDLSCYGRKEYQTPHLDRLAASGMRFTDFHTAAAVCSASRAALLTGCYPQRVGILGALNHAAKHGIHKDELLLPEILKSKGYATAMVGKWHLGHLEPFLPTRNGFDQYFGLPYSNDMWPFHPSAKNFPPLPLFENEKILHHNPDLTGLTGSYHDRAIKFIEAKKDEPFFLYLPHSMPHVPLFVGYEHYGKTGSGIYGDVISEIDAGVGRIVATLDKLGLTKNTLVLFSSDNGPWLSYGNHAGSRLHYREGKGTTFQGGMRVPLIASWPEKIPAGKTCDELAVTFDLLPTIAKLAGAELPAHKIDGRDISPLLLGEANAKSPHESFNYYWNNGLDAIRSGPWKLHFPHPYMSLTGSPGKDGLPGGYSSAKIELSLYNLSDDPSESKNVLDEHPEIVARLRKLADAARADLGDEHQKITGQNRRQPGRVE